MADTPDYTTLLQDYVRICNSALEANKNCYPYMRVLVEIEDRLSHPVRGAVFHEDENHPEAFFELVAEDKRIGINSVHEPFAHHPWLISRHYLEEVTQHPDIYINNPASLDWRWLNDHELG